MVKSSPALIQEYQAILASNGIPDPIRDIEIENPDLSGQHYASSVQYLTIHFESARPALELFDKKMLEEPGRAALIEGLGVFPKEAGVYNHLHVDMRAFCKERTGTCTQLNFLPKSYYADSTKIVLENLAKRGYVLLPRMERQDLNTAKMVLKNLAFYHGVSYGMLQGAGKEAFISKYPSLTECLYIAKPNVQIKAMWMDGLKNCTSIIEAASEFPEKSKILAKLSEYNDGKVFDELCRAVGDQSEHLFRVANHGDCWNNNMLFHQDPVTGELDHNVLLDFQVGRVGSPNLDLAHFLFTSVKPEIRRKRLNDLLGVYFEGLQEALKELNCTFDYTFEEFYQDYKSKSSVGFWMNMSQTTVFEILNENNPDQAPGAAINEWIQKNPGQALRLSTQLVATIYEQFGQL